MGIEKYVSEPREISFSQELVYNKLSDLNNLQQFVTAEKIGELQQNGVNTSGFNLEDFVASEDRCSFKISPIGNVGIEITERDPFMNIKFQGEKSVPFPVTLWIQIVPTGENSCKLRLTLHAELSMMIKVMVGSYLKKGIEKIAGLLAVIDYSIS